MRFMREYQLRHSERHTYTFKYDIDKIDYALLLEEISLFEKHYPNAIIGDELMGQVSISYENISNARLVAEGAAEAFRARMRNFMCWVEV